MKERPIEYCYWVEEGLLAGEYPRSLDDRTSRARLQKLVDAGVSLFVDLTEEREQAASGPLLPYAPLLPELAGSPARHRRFPIRDVSVPESPDLVRAALDAIEEELAAGGTVYVHCLGGVGRTGTIVGCWLARRGHVGAAALDRLRELWSANPKSAWTRSPETSAQEAWVRNWREDGAAAG